MPSLDPSSEKETQHSKRTTAATATAPSRSGSVPHQTSPAPAGPGSEGAAGLTWPGWPSQEVFQVGSHHALHALGLGLLPELIDIQPPLVDPILQGCQHRLHPQAAMAEADDQSFLHPLPGLSRPLATPGPPLRREGVSLSSLVRTGICAMTPQGVDAGSASETVVAA